MNLSPGQYRVGIILGDRHNPFWKRMKDTYEALASGFGIHAVYAWPTPGDEAKTQLIELRKMLETDFHAIIINAINQYNLVPGIIEAAFKKIPVLDVGAKTNGKAVDTAKPFYVSVKTVDFYQQGVLGANYIIQRLRSVNGGKVAIVEGYKESIQSIYRSQGAADTFLNASGILIAGRSSADFKRKKAAKCAIQILKQIPDLSAFFCVNDQMALGVAEAIRSISLRKRIIIVGVDLIDEVENAILADEIDASVAFSVSDVSRVLLNAAVKRIRGQSIPDCFSVASYLVDRQMLTQ